MKKNLKKRLKLTKTTISNLDRVKGGSPDCACDFMVGNAACNFDHVQTVNQSACLSCYEDIFTSCG